MIDVPEQVRAAVELVTEVVPGLLGIHLYGSAVVGGLRPDSDLDLLVMTERPLDRPAKRELVDRLLPISGTTPDIDGLRPLEVTVVARADVVPWRYPPRIDLQYGEWVRDELADPDADLASFDAPDLAIVLTMAGSSSVALLGPPLLDLAEPVPPADLRRAMTDELPSLLDELENDTRNVLLTLARIAFTLETGGLGSKADAATWMIDRLDGPDAEVMARARDLYVGGGFGTWEDVEAVRRAANAMLRMIQAL